MRYHEIITDSKKDEKFKPHMMYDPKTGKGKMANKEQDHKDLAKKGWGHDKPKKAELEEQQELDVVNSDEKQVTLVDPKTKVQTIVPKDPNKPGLIQADPDDPTGKSFKLDMKASGQVDNKIQPGSKVKVAGPM